MLNILINQMKIKYLSDTITLLYPS